MAGNGILAMRSIMVQHAGLFEVFQNIPRISSRDMNKHPT